MSNLAGELARRLAQQAEAVCRHYLSNGCRTGRYWRVGDVANTPGRSLYVRLSGSTAGSRVAGNRLFELGLGPVALALCGASSPDDQRLIDRCLSGGDPTRFAGQFLEAKGLAWAAELIGRWPWPAAPPPIPQASVPIDPAEGAPPASPTPRQSGTTPSPKAAAPADKPRTAAAPLPGLPGGPPMPERLSPFRVLPAKSKRGAR